jgi:hypothetical protein
MWAAGSTTSSCWCLPTKPSPLARATLPGIHEPPSDTDTFDMCQAPTRSVIANGEREQAKALLATLINEFRVNGCSEVLRTYRVGAPVVCVPHSPGEPTDLKSNRSAQLPGGKIALAPRVQCGSSCDRMAEGERACH